MHLFGIGIGGEGDALQERYIFLSSSLSFLFSLFFFSFTFETFKTTLLRACTYVMRVHVCEDAGGGEGESASLYFRFPIVSSLQRRPATPL